MKQQEFSNTPATEKEPSPHTAFIEEWHLIFQEYHARPYMMIGGKDGTAAKRLLAASDHTPHELVMLARQAWEQASQGSFWCKQGLTIAGFTSKHHEILAELSQPSRRVSTVWELKARLDIMKERATNIKKQFTYEVAGSGTVWQSKEQKEKFRGLKKKIREIEDQIIGD